MDLIELVNHFWRDLSLGQLPDLGSWNYGLMALFILLQGRLSAVVTGVAAAAGYLNIGPIILIGILVRVTVDIAWYRIGASGRFARAGSRINLYKRIAEPVQEDLNARPMRYILLAKLTNGLSIPAILLAGNSGLPLKRWLPGSIVADLIWTIPLLLFGYLATDALSTVNGGLTYLTFAFSAVFIVAFTIKLAVRKRLNDLTRDKPVPPPLD